MARQASTDRPRLRTAERRQVELRPVALDDLAPADHRVRLVWRFVEELDLSALLAAIRAVEGLPGHPPADPRILVALWLFATLEGIGSARQVARLCDEHIAHQLRRAHRLPVAVRRRRHECQDAGRLPGRS